MIKISIKCTLFVHCVFCWFCTFSSVLLLFLRLFFSLGSLLIWVLWFLTADGDIIQTLDKVHTCNTYRIRDHNSFTMYVSFWWFIFSLKWILLSFHSEELFLLPRKTAIIYLCLDFYSFRWCYFVLLLIFIGILPKLLCNELLKKELFDFQCIRIFLKLFPPLKCHTIGCSISKHLLISFSIFFFFTKFLLRQMVVPLRALLQSFWWIIHYLEIIKTLWRWLIMNFLLFQQISLFFIAILKMCCVCFLYHPIEIFLMSHFLT